MIDQDDSAGRAGGLGLPVSGSGLSCTRNCLPCGKNFLNQIGGGSYRYRGVPNVWHCSGCKAVRAAKLEQKAAA